MKGNADRKIYARNNDSNVQFKLRGTNEMEHKLNDIIQVSLLMQFQTELVSHMD